MMLDGFAQSDKFKQAPRALGCDFDLQRFKVQLGKLVENRPMEKPE